MFVSRWTTSLCTTKAKVTYLEGLFIGMTLSWMELIWYDLVLKRCLYYSICISGECCINEHRLQVWSSPAVSYQFYHPLDIVHTTRSSLEILSAQSFDEFSVTLFPSWECAFLQVSTLLPSNGIATARWYMTRFLGAIWIKAESVKFSWMANEQALGKPPRVKRIALDVIYVQEFV